MKINNNTSFKVIAFCWHISHGYGDDVEIEPGDAAEINGPYIGEMGSGSWHIAIEGEISCHETPDDEDGFQVLKGSQLNLGSGEKGITVRHHSEERVII